MLLQSLPNTIKVSLLRACLFKLGLTSHLAELGPAPAHINRPIGRTRGFLGAYVPPFSDVDPSLF